MKKLLLIIFEWVDDLGVKYFNDNMSDSVKWGIGLIVSIVSFILSAIACRLWPSIHFIVPIGAILIGWLIISIIATVVCGVAYICDSVQEARSEFRERKRTRNRMMSDC